MKEYTIPDPHGGEMTIQLDDEAAQAQDLLKGKKTEDPATKQAAEPTNKARPAATVKNKSEGDSVESAHPRQGGAAKS